MTFRWPGREFPLDRRQPGGRHRHDLSGDQPRAAPLGGGEHLSRPRAAHRAWPCRPPQDARRGAGSAEALQSRHRCRPPARGFRRRDPADGGDRPRRHPERAARHHGRADLLARRARGRGAVRHDPHAEGGRRRHDLHQPPPGRALRDLRPRHDHARRPHGCGQRDEGHLQDRACPHHARQGTDGVHRRSAQPRGRRRRDAGRGRKPVRRRARARRLADHRQGRDRRPCRTARLRPHRDGAADLCRRPARRRNRESRRARIAAIRSRPTPLPTASASSPRTARSRASFPR